MQPIFDRPPPDKIQAKDNCKKKKKKKIILPMSFFLLLSRGSIDTIDRSSFKKKKEKEKEKKDMPSIAE